MARKNRVCPAGSERGPSESREETVAKTWGLQTRAQWLMGNRGTFGVGTGCPHMLVHANGFPGYSSEWWMYTKTITVGHRGNIRLCSFTLRISSQSVKKWEVLIFIKLLKKCQNHVYPKITSSTRYSYTYQDPSFQACVNSYCFDFWLSQVFCCFFFQRYLKSFVDQVSESPQT